jgi:ribonuclease HII
MTKKNPERMPLRLVVENRADSRYLTCMAASIVAKVTRDREIRKLHQLFGDFGSGYPSDPKTRKFLTGIGQDAVQKLSPHIRFKWQTLKHLNGLIRHSREACPVPGYGGGNPGHSRTESDWIPAFAGMTAENSAPARRP